MSDRQNHSLNLLDLVICIAAVFKLSVSIKISLARLKILVKTQEIIALTIEIPERDMKASYHRPVPYFIAKT